MTKNPFYVSRSKNRQIPGHEPYVDAYFMQDIENFFVATNLVSDTVTLSNDSRVTRIKTSEWSDVLHKNGYNGNCYILIGLKEKSDDGTRIVISFANLYDPLAAHGYEFIFTLEDGEIKVESELQWVS